MNSNEDDSANPSDSGEDPKRKSGDDDLHCPGDSGDGSVMDDVDAGAVEEREDGIVCGDDSDNAWFLQPLKVVAGI